MKQLPTYAELSKALGQTTLKLHPSQIHGLIAGILCGPAAKSQGAWAKLIKGDEETAVAHEVLQGVYDMTAKQLGDYLFDFQLLLPPDSEDLPVCAEALTLWCQGFLTGLKMVDVPLVDREPDEVTEVITDLVEIASMNYEEVVASEEDEAAYVELVEYVRMGAILIFQDLHEKEAASKASQSSGHLH